MTREEMVAAAKAKQRQEMIAQAKAKMLKDAEDQLQIGPEYGDDPNVINKMPDYVTAGERAIAQNLANSPEAKLAYLKQQHPSKNITVGKDGAILFAEPNGKYTTLDPKPHPIDDPMGFIKDLPQDALDVAWDIPNGIGQGAAKTAGALYGATLGGGVGALPMSMAASGAYGGFTEALRQKLGQLAGVPQDVNGKQVAINAAISAADPLAFGAGNASKSQIAKLAEKIGGGEEAATKLYNDASRGLFSRLGEKFGTKALAAGSGIDEQILENYKDPVKRAELQALESGRGGGITGKIDSIRNKIDQYGDAENKRLGEAVGESIDALGKPVSTKQVAAVYDTPIREISALKTPAPLDKDILKAYQDSKYAHLGVEDLNAASAMSADEATFLGLPVPSQQERQFLPDETTAKELFRRQQLLRQSAKFQGNDTVNSSKSAIAKKAWGAINNTLEEASNGATQEAKDKFAKQKALNDYLENQFGIGNNPNDIAGAQKAYNTIVGLDKKNKTMLMDQLGQLADSDKLNLKNDIDAVNLFNQLGDRSVNNPYVSRSMMDNVTKPRPLAKALGAAGGLIGYAMGHGVGGSAGLFGGTALGQALSSPMMTRNFLNAGIRGSELANKANLPAWLSVLMQQQATKDALTPSPSEP